MLFILLESIVTTPSLWPGNVVWLESLPATDTTQSAGNRCHGVVGAVRKRPWKLKHIVNGVGTQLRSLAMVFSHAFRPRDTLCYPGKGTFSTTISWSYRADRDPMVMNVVWLVTCVRSLPSQLYFATKSGTGWRSLHYQSFSVSTSRVASFAASARSMPNRRFSWPWFWNGRIPAVRIWWLWKKICWSAAPVNIRIITSTCQWYGDWWQAERQCPEEAAPIDVKSILP